MPVSRTSSLYMREVDVFLATSDEALTSYRDFLDRGENADVSGGNWLDENVRLDDEMSVQ